MKYKAPRIAETILKKKKKNFYIIITNLKLTIKPQ